MLTVDFSRFPVAPGDRVLDLGCGGGRHAFECYRRGAHVVALDRDENDLDQAAGWLGAMREAGEAPRAARAHAVRGDALGLPFPDGAFDAVIASEVMEHVPDDTTALAEAVRVLRPGGRIAVTVPRYGPERICWALSESYHQAEGGHVRIYRRDALLRRLREAGLRPYGVHHAHALHSPYWWLRCALGGALGSRGEEAWPVRAYHRLLVWDITSRPLATRAAEGLLDPLLGKSLVVYATKPHATKPHATKPRPATPSGECV